MAKLRELPPNHPANFIEIRDTLIRNAQIVASGNNKASRIHECALVYGEGEWRKLSGDETPYRTVYWAQLTALKFGGFRGMLLVQRSWRDLFSTDSISEADKLRLVHAMPNDDRPNHPADILYDTGGLAYWKYNKEGDMTDALSVISSIFEGKISPHLLTELKVSSREIYTRTGREATRQRRLFYPE